MLKAFIRLLIDNGLLRPAPPADDDGRLDETKQINDCAIIAGRLGLEHGYVFDNHFYGPHSDELRAEIRTAAPRARAGLGSDAPPLPACFDKDRFLRLLAGKDSDWISAAASLIIHSHSRPDVESMVDWIGGLTVGRSPEYCRGIVQEMTSPEVGIVLDCDKFVYDEPWRPALASATHYVGAAPPPPVPAAAG